jgi:16S rRNA (cytosine967-C5)-methyltransferase
MTPRELACAALGGQDQPPGFSERYLEAHFRQDTTLTERDRAFAVHLVQGVIRWRLRLDWIIKQAARFPFKKIERPVLDILRVALYQIFFLDRVPDSAAVNEAVKQAGSLGREHVTRFVNGLLREVCRRKDSLSFPDRAADRTAYLSTFHSYPSWLVEKWIRELGVAEAEGLMAAGNRLPKLVIRMNPLKTDLKELAMRLEEEGVECGEPLTVPGAVLIAKAGGSIARLSAFKMGLFQVQSEAAQICSYLLSPGSGEDVLDLCSGRGGKATHLAEISGCKSRIIALDIDHGRLVSLSENARRLGIRSIHSVRADGAVGLPFSQGRLFHRIMVDAPCSSLGTISRHPDVKWARGENDIQRLAGMQEKILSAALPFLEKKGRLLYVTCTISREENEMVVERFLEKNIGVKQVDLRKEIPEWGRSLINDDGFFKTSPHRHDMDGFFGALFVKKG